MDPDFISILEEEDGSEFKVRPLLFKHDFKSAEIFKFSIQNGILYIRMREKRLLLTQTDRPQPLKN